MPACLPRRKCAMVYDGTLAFAWQGKMPKKVDEQLFS
jgi:hypothetical protein